MKVFFAIIFIDLCNTAGIYFGWNEVLVPFFKVPFLSFWSACLLSWMIGSIGARFKNNKALEKLGEI